jgi:hypothetical protein
MDAVFEIVRLAEGVGGAVEAEQPAAFSVKDIVGVTGGGTQSIGKVLAGKFHEIAEAADAPELEHGEDFGDAGERGEKVDGEAAEIVAIDEAALALFVAGGEVGEIGVFGAGVPDFGMGDFEVVEEGDFGFGRAGEVENEGVVVGDFEIGGEGFGERDEFVEELGFGFGLLRKDFQMGATDEGTAERPAGFDAGEAGGVVDGEEGDFGFGVLAIHAGVDDGGGHRAQFRLNAEGGEHFKIWEMEGGEHFSSSGMAAPFRW